LKVRLLDLDGRDGRGEFHARKPLSMLLIARRQGWRPLTVSGVAAGE